MKADDDTMNPLELALFEEVCQILDQQGITTANGLRPICIRSNGKFASLTLTCPAGFDFAPYENTISALVRPLSIHKIAYRKLPPVEVQKSSAAPESTAPTNDPFSDPFADMSFGSRN